jgi:hypothetical protein
MRNKISEKKKNAGKCESAYTIAAIAITTTVAIT